MRKIAFIAVVCSTAAIITSVVTLPMLYNYVQSFQSHLMVETDYCKVGFQTRLLFSVIFGLQPVV